MRILFMNYKDSQIMHASGMTLIEVPIYVSQVQVHLFKKEI